MNHSDDNNSGYASPPCFAHELSLGDNGYVVSDAQAACDVARWRKAERERLIDLRVAIPARDRQRHAEQVAVSLEKTIGNREDAIVSLYWPFRAELNLRHWMQEVVEDGVRVALPVVEAKSRPLIFREWLPDCPMQPGVWNIPVPVDGEVLQPTHVIAPLVGFDARGYRLGYGGGYYDRTLALMRERRLAPAVIGVGHSVTRIATIYPQPHDIPMDFIITECDVLQTGGL
ncbi:5-formyltetrahydrofolate cyclo-ligase [Granulosicoccus sp. 3-233]|uniref:5-formyltetrahydrofolate cyclo-ligase n=1 Tax=Granulosicoccus sp. 3-233 TaxID=3417969 RepID=UPI003D332EED